MCWNITFATLYSLSLLYLYLLICTCMPTRKYTYYAACAEFHTFLTSTWVNAFVSYRPAANLSESLAISSSTSSLPLSCDVILSPHVSWNSFKHIHTTHTLYASLDMSAVNLLHISRMHCTHMRARWINVKLCCTTYTS